MMIVRFVQTNFMNVSLQEMALKKLLTKKARKDAAGDGSSAAPQVDMEFDGHRFRSEDHQRRFEAIKGWSFIRERRVQLREVEYVEFKEEIDKRQ